MEAGGTQLHHCKRHSGARTLVVGHYCHDLIKLSSGEEVQALGGSVSYITNIFNALGLESKVVSNVGSDFAYGSVISHPPSVLSNAVTTRFYADFTAASDRVLRVSNACDPIHPSNIPSGATKYKIGLAVGIAREILPETLRRMVQVSNLVVVDIQALIRTIDPVDGTVGLRNLSETDFYEFLDQISFLKASSLESVYINIVEARQKTCVIVTEGKNGCMVYARDREFHVAAFPAEEIDPTGAGDSFLAGFSAGLIWGLSVEDAVLVGNFFGALTVGQIGVPRVKKEQLQRLQDELDKRVKNGICTPTQLDSSNNPMQLDSTNSPTHMDSVAFCVSPKSEESDEQRLQEELDRRIKNGLCCPTQVDCASNPIHMDSADLRLSAKGEELDNQRLQEEIDRTIINGIYSSTQMDSVEFVNSLEREELDNFSSCGGSMDKWY